MIHLRLALVGAVLLSLLGACRTPFEAVREPERLTYCSYRPAGWDIYLQEKAGEEARRLTVHPALDYDAVFSPDGRWVVFASERTGDPSLFVLDLEERGEPRLLVRGTGMQDQATISPDGSTIVFVSTHGGDADLYGLPFRPEQTQSLEAARNLTSHPGGDFRPAFSPDGQSLAFCSDRDGGTSRHPRIPFALQKQGDLYLMSADGGDAQRLTTAPGWDGSPSWAADGESLLFYSERDSDVSYRVHALELATGNVVPVTPASVVALSPVLQPDGTVLFGTWAEGENERRWSVMSMNLEGDVQRVSEGALDAFHPQSHPNTGALLFHGAPPFTEASISSFPGPFLVEPNGEDPGTLDRPIELVAQRHAFTAPPGPHRSEVAYRPSPRRIGLAGSSGESVSLVLDVDDHPQVGPGVISHLRFEEGGDWISFTVGPFGGPPDAEAEAWRVRTDGSGLVNLTGTVPGNDGLAEFREDGSAFVFRSGRTGDFDIYLASADGTEPRNLTDHPARDTFPALSPDGSRFVFASDRNGVPDAANGRRNFDLYLSELDDEGGADGLRRITDNESQNAHAGFSPDGEWLIYSSGRYGISDEQPLVQEVLFNPQMYGELFAYRVRDGERVRLTHNKWEDGAPVWKRAASAPSRPPVATALAGVIAENGAEAGASEYRRLRAGEPEAYRFGEGGLLSLADRFRAEGNLEAVAATYRVLSDVPSWSRGAQLRLAEFHLDSGRPEEAEAAYRSVLERNPNDVEAQWSLFRMGAAGYEALELPTELLESFAGTYVSTTPNGEPAAISRAGELLLVVPPGAPGPIPFQPVSGSRFFSPAVPAQITFSFAADGEVETVRVEFPGGREVLRKEAKSTR